MYTETDFAERLPVLVQTSRQQGLMFLVIKNIEAPAVFSPRTSSIGVLDPVLLNEMTSDVADDVADRRAPAQ
jgi:hypothetical protein